MLYEITLNPAMGNYLDVVNNTKATQRELRARGPPDLSLGTVRLNPDGTQQLDAEGRPIPTYSPSTSTTSPRVHRLEARECPARVFPNYLDPMVPNAAQHDRGEDPAERRRPQAEQTPPKTERRDRQHLQRSERRPFISRQLIQHLVTSNPTHRTWPACFRVRWRRHTVCAVDLRAVVEDILLDTEARGAIKTDPDYGHLRHPALSSAGSCGRFPRGQRASGRATAT